MKEIIDILSGKQLKILCDKPAFDKHIILDNLTICKIRNYSDRITKLYKTRDEKIILIK